MAFFTEKEKLRLIDILRKVLTEKIIVTEKKYIFSEIDVVTHDHNCHHIDPMIPYFPSPLASVNQRVTRVRLMTLVKMWHFWQMRTAYLKLQCDIIRNSCYVWANILLCFPSQLSKKMNLINVVFIRLLILDLWTIQEWGCCWRWGEGRTQVWNEISFSRAALKWKLASCECF